MIQKALLPNKYKRVGWLIMIPCAILWFYGSYTEFEYMDWDVKIPSIIDGGLSDDYKFLSLAKIDLAPTLLGILFILGGLMVGFSKEKHEDEFISNLRESSLIWAVLLNYALLIFAFIFIHGMAFLDVMVYNMFTVLIFFIVRFNYVLYRNAKNISDEKYN